MLINKLKQQYLCVCVCTVSHCNSRVKGVKSDLLNEPTCPVSLTCFHKFTQPCEKQDKSFDECNRT